MVVSALSHWNAASFWEVYIYNESAEIFSFFSFNVLAQADILVRSAVLMEIVYLVTLAYDFLRFLSRNSLIFIQLTAKLFIKVNQMLYIGFLSKNSCPSQASVFHIHCRFCGYYTKFCQHAGKLASLIDGYAGR